MSLKSLFFDIADAIREKDGTTEEIVASTFPDRVRSLQVEEDLGDLISIEIVRGPFKTVYANGGTFDPSGMVVLAHYENGKPQYVILEDLTFSPLTLSSSTTKVTVSLSNNGKTVSVDQSIVVAKSVCFGVMWDYSKGDTGLTRLTVSGDPNLLVSDDVLYEPVIGTGFQSGISPFDTVFPWAGMEEYNVIDNSVAYRYGQNEFSRSNHDTVVYIPSFYYRVIDDSTNKKRYWYISSDAKTDFAKHPGSDRYVGKYSVNASTESKSGSTVTAGLSLSACRSNALSKGDGWYLYDFACYCAIRLLYLVEFADWDSQSKLGVGLTTTPMTTGVTDSIPYHTGASNGHVKYRNIEDPYMGYWEYIDGVIQNTYQPYVCTDPKKYADSVTSDYEAIGITNPRAQREYIKTIGYSAEHPWVFIPSELGGDSTEWITDVSYSVVGDGIVCFGGGYHGTGQGGGMFAIAFYQHASTTYSFGRSRTMFIDE